MNPRRKFLALVGSVTLAGPVLSKFGFSEPTLILPPTPMVIPESQVAVGEPLLTLLHIRKSVPEKAFESWMFLELQTAKMYGGRDELTVHAEIEAAVERHGSIIAAMKAGAL